MSNPRLIRLARRVNWYTPPEQLAGDPDALLAEVMARGAPEDVREVQGLFAEDDFRRAYKAAPAGLFGRSAWAYWGLKLLGSATSLPYPVRFPEVADMVWPESFQRSLPEAETNAAAINALARPGAGNSKR